VRMKEMLVSTQNIGIDYSMTAVYLIISKLS